MAINDVNDGDILEEADWDSVITTVENISTGHVHDGADSRVISSSSAVGNVYVLKKGAGQETGSAPAVVDSYTFSANELAAGDMLEVNVLTNLANDGASPEIKLTTTNTSSDGDLTSGLAENINTRGTITAYIYQDIDQNDLLNTHWMCDLPNVGYVAGAVSLDTDDANILTTGWTLNLSIDANACTTEWYWIVKRVTAV